MLGAMVFSTTAMAYDDLITNDTAAVKATGGLCGSVSLLYQTASKYYVDTTSKDLPGDNATQIRVPIRVNFGVMDKLTVFGILPIVSFDSGVKGADSNSGIGDIWVGAKYAVMAKDLLTIRGALDIPSGEDKKSLGNPGGFGVDVAALSAYQVDKIGMNGQVGLRYNAEGPENAGKWQPGIGVYVAAQGDYAVTEAVKGIVGLEFMSVADGKADGKKVSKSGTNYLDINVGAACKIADKMGLRGDVMYTVAGKNTYQNLGILVSLGYAVK